MDWYRVVVATIFDAESLQHQFESIFMASRGPKNAALFTNILDGDPLYFYYFSPGAAAIAMTLIKAYSGSPCTVPQRKTTALLIGDSSALGMLEGRPAGIG